MNMKAAKSIVRRDAGIALLTTLLLLILMSSLLVGFILLVIGGSKLSGMNDDYSKAYYGAEAGMEKMTADLGTLFDQNYSPSGAQVAAITTVPPTLNGIQFIDPIQTSGYNIDFPHDGSGNPLASNAQVKTGPYQGMVALSTPYTLTITSHTTPGGSEVKLRRTTQTVGIPMFQFGVFCDGDCSFFPGPVFNFGGRTHTNGNLFLASGNTLTLGDRVTAVKNVIRTNLSNGFDATAGAYNGSVNIATSSGSPPPVRSLAFTEGSLIGNLGTSPNPNWQTISMGAANYNGYLRGGTTAPSAPLNLGVVTLGGGITQSIDVIRRPPGPENNSVTAERYFAQASMKILLSDNPVDIMNLPCIDPTVQPFNLADLAADPSVAGNWSTANAVALKAKMTANNTAGLNTQPVALAASGALGTSTSYNPTNIVTGDPQGYWIPKAKPIIKGFIKIEVQKGYGSPCNAWKDVTIEVLSLGYAGKDINPTPITGAGSTAAGLIPLLRDNTNGATVGNHSQLTPPVGNAVAFSGLVAPIPCLDVHPNAIIRLERVRDNPSTATTTNGSCGVNLAAGQITGPTGPTDYWPNVLFDTREGTLRDFAPSSSTGVNNIKYSQMVALSGVMHYVELDAANVAKYFSGVLGTNGVLAFDANVAPNDFTVYISDRRDNYAATQSWTNWPPLSPGLHETGEYGYTDVVNASATTTGCPNGAIETGEDLDATGFLYTYGADITHTSLAYNAASPWTGGYGFFSNLSSTAFTPNPACASVTGIWPGAFVVHSNEVRQNPNFFFRRAIKIVNGSFLNLGNCPGSTSTTTIPCGLTIAAENPVYVQGDFNANSNGNGFNDPHVATSIAADAVTLLSDNWNDYNSFLFPYQQSPVSTSPAPVTNPGQRAGYTSWYRVAVAAGKGISFPQPTGTSQDFGTDGGVHNFFRYIEHWGNQTLNYRGSIINLFTNRQAIGTFKCCTLVYNPPTRGYNFDVEFLDPQLLPPRTPLFRDVNTTGFTQLLLPNQQ
jgi:hypothetical protein